MAASLCVDVGNGSVIFIAKIISDYEHLNGVPKILLYFLSKVALIGRSKYLQGVREVLTLLWYAV